MQKVNLAEKLARITDAWSPKAIAAVNDFHVKLVRLEGSSSGTRTSWRTSCSWS